MKNKLFFIQPKNLFPKYFHINFLSKNYFCTNDTQDIKKKKVFKTININEYTPEKIRNFCIIAHIDHGKSTLSDRLIEKTNLISKDENISQFLDNLQVEKERGITVRSQTITLKHDYKGEKYLLNLIDTPGHVDFSFEVSRILPVCNGAILLVDATKGVQAQTISHFNKALLSELSLIPVLNKIDVDFAKPDQVINQLKELFTFDRNEILKVSAKTGVGISELLDELIVKIPSPLNKLNQNFQATIFDCWHVSNEGVQVLIKVDSGKIQVKDKIKFLSFPDKIFEIRKLGIFHPDEKNVDCLSCGQIGFFGAFIHDLNQIRLGDLIFNEKVNLEEIKIEIPKIEEAKQMVYAGIYPCDESQSNFLKQAIKKINLTDKSVVVENDTNPALGLGFRLGFQGLLHMDIFSQRLDQEFDAPTVITAPNVTYKIKIKGAKNIKQYGNDIIYIRNPNKLPDRSIIEYMEEPIVKATIIVPNDYVNKILIQARERRGISLSSKFIDQNNVLMQIQYPLNEIIVDFYDELKTLTSGYASFDYEEDGFKKVDAVLLSFNLNNKTLDEMTMIVPKSKSKELAKHYCQKIKKNLKQQLFDITIHGCINKKIIAKEEIKATGKDVTAKLYGGDITRAKKLLKRQEEGKNRLRMVGKIAITREILINILKR